jgi:hypothetical protein
MHGRSKVMISALVLGVGACGSDPVPDVGADAADAGTDAVDGGRDAADAGTDIRSDLPQDSAGSEDPTVAAWLQSEAAYLELSCPCFSDNVETCVAEGVAELASTWDQCGAGWSEELQTAFRAEAQCKTAANETAVACMAPLDCFSRGQCSLDWTAAASACNTPEVTAALESCLD